jgi:hypothetical protein
MYRRLRIAARKEITGSSRTENFVSASLNFV